MPASSHVLDPVRVSFDDDNAVADAGLLLSPRAPSGPSTSEAAFRLATARMGSAR